MKLSNLLGRIWALPLTAAGVAQAAIGGARYLGTERGILHFANQGRGLVGVFFRRTGVVAYTWGHTITLRDASLREDERLLRHERHHVRQAMQWGVALPLAYVVASLAAGFRGGGWYRDNAFERAARRAAGPLQLPPRQS